jgi:hypothetical protein
VVSFRTTEPEAVPAPAPLRNVYTVEQFAAEVLQGNRHANWVRSECKAKRIKAVARRPWLIPQSEAVRFITPTK